MDGGRSGGGRADAEEEGGDIKAEHGAPLEFRWLFEMEVVNNLLWLPLVVGSN